jgi:type II secretory pathway pseudopilin PulG
VTTVSRAQIIGGLLAAVVLAAIIAGLLLIGSPADERARRLDERRVADLTNISNAIDLYWTRQMKLPSSLDELKQEPGGNVSLRDPITDEEYEYRQLEGETYELCAEFDGQSPQSDRREVAGFWSHAAGRYCFRRDARKAS